MTFDEQKFKRAWRKLCSERGVDPVEGATGYQVANYNAERRKRLHDRYSSVMTLLHFARHPELVPIGGVRWRARSDWWTKPEYWHNPPDRRGMSPYVKLPDTITLHASFERVETAAIVSVQKQANDARESRFVEKVYNHPPIGRRRILRKFAAGMEIETVARRDGVRQNVTQVA